MKQGRLVLPLKKQTNFPVFKWLNLDNRQTRCHSNTGTEKVRILSFFFSPFYFWFRNWMVDTRWRPVINFIAGQLICLIFKWIYIKMPSTKAKWTIQKLNLSGIQIPTVLFFWKLFKQLDIWDKILDCLWKRLAIPVITIMKDMDMTWVTDKIVQTKHASLDFRSCLSSAMHCKPKSRLFCTAQLESDNQTNPVIESSITL
jgi:hypothetical protein